MRVLIVNPDLQALGGVTEYVVQLSKHLSVDKVHFAVGKRVGEHGKAALLVRFVRDMVQFVRVLRQTRPDVVHVNPSLDWKGFIRDGLLTRLAARRGYPVVVFFHGWYEAVANRIEQRFLGLFNALFGHAAGFIVLTSEVEKTLRRWGLKQPIQREVTIVDDALLEGFDLEKQMEKRAVSEKWRLLFIGRVVRPKGIFEAMDTARLLQKCLPEAELIIAGDGPDLDEARAFATEHELNNVRFAGRVNAEEKRHLYEESHALFLPSYTEGLPGVVVEAMAFGLPVITRPVGGIPDVLINGDHGFLIKSLEPEDFAECIQRLKNDPELYHSIAKRNASFARDHFLASTAAPRIEQFYRACLNPK